MRTHKKFIGVAITAFIIAGSVSAHASGQSDTWKVVAPEGEGFSVKLPISPEISSDRVPMMGNIYQMRLYTASDRETGLLYMVVMQEFPSLTGALTPAKRLDSFANGFKSGLGESLSAAVGGKFEMTLDRELNLGSNIGRQYLISIGESRGLVRAFDGGRRVYVLLILGAQEKDPAVSRFFSSFEIRPAPDPVPQPIDSKPL
jgi:hypothetical protein